MNDDRKPTWLPVSSLPKYVRDDLARYLARHLDSTVDQLDATLVQELSPHPYSHPALRDDPGANETSLRAELDQVDTDDFGDDDDWELPSAIRYLKLHHLCPAGELWVGDDQMAGSDHGHSLCWALGAVLRRLDELERATGAGSDG